jgi:DNA-directed RNA polymerase specialized sigma24 family protein
MQEYSIRETAEAAGISVAAAKARLFHAKAALRRSPILKPMQHTLSGGQIRSAA